MRQSLNSVNDTDINFNSTALSYNNHLLLPASQFIGILIACSAILLAIIVLCVLILYQKYRIRIQKISLTSTNPCYISEDNRDIQGHCNLSVTNDTEGEIDDVTSLDNDSFLNSLEHLQFVGYLNQARNSNFSTSIDHSLSRISSTSVETNKKNQSGSQHQSHSNKTTPTAASSSNTTNNVGVQLRVRKSKRSAVHSVDCDKITISSNHYKFSRNPTQRFEVLSETISESSSSTTKCPSNGSCKAAAAATGSTINLIGSSSSTLFLDHSQDNINVQSHQNVQTTTCDGQLNEGHCDQLEIANNNSNEDSDTEMIIEVNCESGNVSNQQKLFSSQESPREFRGSAVMATSTEKTTVVDKMDSSTDSRSSTNSTSAMMSNYTDGNCNIGKKVMPDLISSAVVNVKRAYTNPSSMTSSASCDFHTIPSNLDDRGDEDSNDGGNNALNVLSSPAPVILDPLTAGFINSGNYANSNMNGSSSNSSHYPNLHYHHHNYNNHVMRHFSHNVNISPRHKTNLTNHQVTERSAVSVASTTG